MRVDRDKAALLGLTVTGVANTIRTNVAGTQAAMFREARQRVSDRRAPAPGRPRRASSTSATCCSARRGGQVLQAKNLMVVDRDDRPDRRSSARTRSASPASTPRPKSTLSEAVAAVQARLPRDHGVPKDFAVGFGAEVEEQAKAFAQLQLVLILAIVLVYAVMASQYESLRDPFIIMFSVPLAAIGVVLALMLTGTPFSMQAYIGVIMLAGIVVSNAILLVDYTNMLRRRDELALREAVGAGRTHTPAADSDDLASATGLGLVPMALGIGEGAELQAPLARVVIGGLMTSTLITLVFVPTVYTLFEEGLGAFKRGGPSNDAAAH